MRRQDSNLRPPGYEPDELPTALLRDVDCASIIPHDPSYVKGDFPDRFCGEKRKFPFPLHFATKAVKIFPV